MKKTYPLTDAQKRIWYAQKKYWDSSLFNIGGTVYINGKIDIHLMQQAIKKVISQNVALQLKFYETGTGIYQFISDEIASIEFIDFSQEEAPEKAYQDWCCEKAETPFSINAKLLYYFSVFKIKENKMGYFVKLHHLIADGWSVQLLTNQIARCYEKLCNQDSSMDEECPSYLDYVLEEQKNNDLKRMEKAKEFWNSMFQSFYNVADKACDCLTGVRKSFLIERGCLEDIKKFIEYRKISFNTFFVSIYLCYLYKTCGENDVVIGIPLLGRTGKRERMIFGTFTNTMPYRHILDVEDSVEVMLKEVSSNLKKCYANQKYQYNMLQKELKLHQHTVNRLFDTCINYYNTRLCQSIDGINTQNIEFYNGQQEYALQIILREWEDDVFCLDFDFQTAVFSEEDITKMYHQLMYIIEQVLKRPDIKIKDITLVKEEEAKRFLYQYNDTDRTYNLENTVIGLFEKKARQYPDKIAVSHRQEVLTYSELLQQSNAVCVYFQQIGVQQGDIIVAELRHCIKSIIIILAIMKYGAIYLPIPIGTPEKRILEIFKHSNANYLLTEHDFLLSDEIPTISIEKICIKDNENWLDCSTPTGLAYIIYTSGSEGEPKGVAVRHRNLTNYLLWAQEEYVKKPHEKFSLYSPFSFDFTMTSLFLPLISGGEIRIYEAAEKKNIFKDIFRENSTTILKITPSHIGLIQDVSIEYTKIHTIIIGGEALKMQTCAELDRHLKGHSRIFNEYGPTEATIGCMSYLYNPTDDGIYVPIGRPAANTQIYLFDKDLKPVPAEMPGEIYVGGAGVAQGYINMPKNINSSFIKDPYKKKNIIYKTGDIAWRNTKGDLVYVGRIDKEVKIRGNRVNLLEIERKAYLSDMIQEAYASVITNYGSNQICLYIIANKKYHEIQFKKYMKQCLPGYMIPQFILRVLSFPLNRNGKINKEQLPLPDRISDVPKIDLTSEGKQLIEMIKKVTGCTTVTAYDNFYSIGGDSIKAIQLSSRLTEVGYELAVHNILKNPVIYEMTKFMRRKENTVCRQKICKGKIMDTPATKYFFQQKFKKQGHYNQAVLLEFYQHICQKELEDILFEIIKHHDALRINWDYQKKILFYNNRHLEHMFSVKVLTVDKTLQKSIKEQVQQDFDLEHDLLFRAYLCETQGKQYVYLLAHHLVVDAVSWQILLRDISSLLSQSEQGQVFKLPPKTMSYQEYAKRYHNQTANIFYDQYFTLTQRKAKQGFSYGTEREIIDFSIGSALTCFIMGAANEICNTKPQELILTAIYVSLLKIFPDKTFICEAEGHGRDLEPNIDICRTVGWFTVFYPITIHMPEDTLIGQIKAVKECWRTADRHKWEEIDSYVALHKNSWIRFNFLGEYTQEENSFFTVKEDLFYTDIASENTIPFLLDINALVQNGVLRLYGTCSSAFVKKTEIQRFCTAIESELVAIQGLYTGQKNKYTPSDFDMVELTQEEIDDILDQ